MRTKECPECKKRFIPGSNYAYKQIENHKLVYYCSYKCWRKNGGDGGERVISFGK